MMSIRPAAFASLGLFALWLGGCGKGGSGGGNDSVGTSSGGSASRYIYVSAYQFTGGAVAGEIYGYRFDSESNELTEVAGSPFSANTSGAPIAITRDAKFIYGQSTNNSLIGLAVQADGSLVPVPGSPLATSEPVGYVVTNPALDYLYAVGAVSSTLTVYTIDSSTGALTEQSTYPGLGISAITPDGKYLYDLTVPEIGEFSIDPTSSAISPLPASPIAFPSQEFSPGGVAMDPSGRFVYTTNSLQLTGFGSPMYGWTIDPTSGALTLISQLFQPTPGPQGSIAIEASGKYAVVNTPVTSKTGPYCFSVLSIDAEDGTLANVYGSPFPFSGGGCGIFAADPSAPYIYATGQNTAGQNGLYVYAFDEGTGVPSLVSSFMTPSYTVANMVLTH